MREPRGDGRWGPLYAVRGPGDDGDQLLQVLQVRDTEYRAGLERELLLQRSFSHPHLVPLTAIVSDGACFGVVHALVEGPCLREVLGDGTGMDAAEAVFVFEQIRSAVQAAHDAGVVHWALTPDDIYLCEQTDGIAARVANFGLGRALRYDREGDRYSAPELAWNEPEPDPRADIYALGCILYEMLTGQPRYTAAYGANPTGAALLREVDGCPPFVAAAIERAVASKPGDRYSDLSQLADALLGVAPAPEPHAPVLPPSALEPAEHGIAYEQELPDPPLRAARRFTQFILAPLLGVGGILYIGAYVTAAPLTRARAAAQLAETAVATDLQHQIDAGKQLILWGAQPAQIEQATFTAAQAHTLAERTAAAHSLSQALQRELHGLGPLQDPEAELKRRAIEHMLETDHDNIADYHAAFEALEAAKGATFAPIADALGLSRQPE